MGPDCLGRVHVLESSWFLADVLTGHEWVRSAGFSPQGRPRAGVASCGLKSAVVGRLVG